MKLIGFKNFRKFEDFPPIDLGPITIFVGENNAGKSTVLKALLSVLDFVKTSAFDTTGEAVTNIRFFFNKSYFSHIGTFKRAIYNKAPDGSAIVFVFAFGLYYFEISVKGAIDDEESISGQVSSIKLTLIDFNIDLNYVFESGLNRLNVVFHSKPNSLKKKPYSKEDQKVVDGYFSDFDSDVEMEMPITGSGMLGGNILEMLLWGFRQKLERTVDYYSATNKPQNPKYSEDIVQGVSSEMEAILISKKRYFNSKFFQQCLHGISYFDAPRVEYIYAHAVTQTVIYSAKDINDYYVKTIHEFANQAVEPDTPVYEFIVKWMKEFGIGARYELTSIGGEAHIVKIVNFDGESVNLADKGMGSIQLMILLFRLATLMSQARIGMGRLQAKALIIVEEPEQNLHPMLQSKLAELFFSMNQDYGFRFIIETHSEYLIRRTQALVGSSYREKKDFENPFKVYYFPANGTPYDMPYAKTGRFEEQFGSGFFDEATKWNREVLRNENAK